MKTIVCKNCGSNQFEEIDGYLVCRFCGTRYVKDEYLNNLTGSSSISIDNDINNLLDKCKSDPKNAKRYVNLILDIDPSNTEAIKLLKEMK
jgi:A2L zinc ribbon domain.